MEYRPRIEIPLTRGDKILDIAAWIVLILLWGLTFMFYDYLPEVIPTKFSGSGEVVNTGSKATILFLPAIASILVIGLSALDGRPNRFNYPIRVHPDNVPQLYSISLRIIRVIKFIIPFVFLLVILLIYRSTQASVAVFHPWIMILILGLILVPLGYFLFQALKLK